MAPLTDITVVDLSRLLPGPAATWYLAALGATVIKVEDPGGDPLRWSGPIGEGGDSVWFTAINRGKRSVVIDLRQDEGRADLLALLEQADVLVEGFRPGVLARLGLDPQVLRARFPRLVIVSISGFGQTGPYREAPGHDLGYMALTGALSLPVWAGGAPTVQAVQVADFAGGALMAALRTLAALLGRGRSGQGDWLDVSMTDGVFSLLAPFLTEAAHTGLAPAPGESLLQGALPVYRCYRCADGKALAFAPLEPKFQAAFQAAMGAEVPLEEEALMALFATEPRDHWCARLTEACVVPVLDLAEALAAPLFRERGLLRGDGAATQILPPFPSAAAALAAPAPALGAHTAAELARVGRRPSSSTESP